MPGTLLLIVGCATPATTASLPLRKTTRAIPGAAFSEGIFLVKLFSDGPNWPDPTGNLRPLQFCTPVRKQGEAMRPALWGLPVHPGSLALLRTAPLRQQDWLGMQL